jgi:hypothetical protein
MKLQWSENWKKITGKGDFFSPGMVGERILKGFLPSLLFENVGDSYDRKSREETHS